MSAAAPPDLVGVSSAMEAVRRAITKLARSHSPVVITGESGTGKELAARLLHRHSGRSDGPFVAVNCGAIPETLLEAEFFGYRKGAFTGADRDRDGFFQAARGGTLLLDEVADLPLGMQVKLLRAIQEKAVRRVGASVEEPVDVRIVSATHQQLADCVAAGRFRHDLYYRLEVLVLHLPPLRDRVEDVAPLVQAILRRLTVQKAAAEGGGEGAAEATEQPRITSSALAFLQRHPFPGNVRELENRLERALLFAEGRPIEVADLGMPDPNACPPPAVVPGAIAAPIGACAPAVRPEGPAPCAGGQESLVQYMDRVELLVINRALEAAGNNRTAAARHLGISFRSLRHRLQRLTPS